MYCCLLTEGMLIRKICSVFWLIPLNFSSCSCYFQKMSKNKLFIMHFVMHVVVVEVTFQCCAGGNPWASYGGFLHVTSEFNSV